MSSKPKTTTEKHKEAARIFRKFFRKKNEIFLADILHKSLKLTSFAHYALTFSTFKV